MAVGAFIAAIVGGLALFWPRSISAKPIRQHAQRLADLRSGATETYFEERRALEAYRPLRSELAWRLFAAILLVYGLWRLFAKT